MKRYSVIYADPPWKYDNQRNNDPKQGGMTYPTMSLADIKALPVGDLAERDCALFMWITMPKLAWAFEVFEAWGFTFTTCAFVWVKLNPTAWIEEYPGEHGKKITEINGGIYSGMGHWTNGNAELCLLAKRGTPKRMAKNVKQIVMAPRSRHSEKPAEVRSRIVELVGDLPRIELFARTRPDDWDVWGNEVDQISPWEVRATMKGGDDNG